MLTKNMEWVPNSYHVDFSEGLRVHAIRDRDERWSWFVECPPVSQTIQSSDGEYADAQQAIEAGLKFCRSIVRRNLHQAAVLQASIKKRLHDLIFAVLERRSPVDDQNLDDVTAHLTARVFSLALQEFDVEEGDE